MGVNRYNYQSDQGYGGTINPWQSKIAKIMGYSFCNESANAFRTQWLNALSGKMWVLNNAGKDFYN